MDSNTNRNYFIRSEVVGHLIASIHYWDYPLLDGYRNRRVIVTLENGVTFDLMDGRESDGNFYISKASVVDALEEVPLDTYRQQIACAIQEVVSSEWWVSPFGILLANGYSVSVGANLAALALDVDAPNEELKESFVHRVLPEA